MNLEKVNNIYFIGIGGIGMSALARYFALSGKKVAGYDKTRTFLTDNLSVLGIEIHYVDDVQQIAENFLDKKRTLVAYTPAIAVNHTKLVYFK